MPIAAATHSVAAVVRPRIDNPWRMIAPAPRKPMPVTIWAAMRVGSARMTGSPDSRNSLKPYAETIVNSADPTHTSMCVRNPASRSRSSRSKPIAPPSRAATASLAVTPSQPSVGTVRLSTDRRQSRVLGFAEPLDPDCGEVEQLVQHVAAERLPLGRRLHLDELARAGHHDVHVHLGRGVLDVLEVEKRLARDDSDRDRGDGSGEGAREAEAVERPVRRNIRAADRRTASPAVGLENVAVEVNRALAERLEIQKTAKRPPDQALDLDCPPLLPTAPRLALHPLARRRRQQRILRCHPPAAGVPEPAWHALLDRCRAQDDRLALPPQRRAVRLLQEVEADVDRAELVAAPSVGTRRCRHAAARSRSASETRSTTSIGSWRKRAPMRLNVSGSPVVTKE